MYRSLADFLEDLEHAGQLQRIEVEVDSALELAEIARQAASGPALLFAHVRGTRAAVVTNLLGHPARLQKALAGRAPSEAAESIATLASRPAAQGWLERLRGGSGASADRFQPKTIRSGPCQQVVLLGSDVDLTALPALQSWPGCGRFLQGMLATAEPDVVTPDLSWMDVEVVGPRELAIRLPAHHLTMQRLEAYAARGERMPVAVVLGGDPAYRLASLPTLASEVESVLLAGLLRDCPVELVKCRAVEMRVPADVDLVLEGFLELEPSLESASQPGGDELYREALPGRRLEVVAITQRTNPVVPAAVLGWSEGEQQAIQQAAMQLAMPLARAIVPDLVDMAMSADGLSLVASLRKRYAHQGRQAASALWGWTPTMFTKLLVLVDPQVDVRDAAAVWRQVTAHAEFPGDLIEHAGPGCNAEGPSRSLAIDATTKRADERANGGRRRVEPSAEVVEQVRRRWAEYGFSEPPRP